MNTNQMACEKQTLMSIMLNIRYRKKHSPLLPRKWGAGEEWAGKVFFWFIAEQSSIRHTHGWGDPLCIDDRFFALFHRAPRRR